MNNLAVVLQGRGKLEEAEPLYRQVLEARRRFLGPEHPQTLIATHNLAWVLQGRGKLEEAEPLCRQVLEARRRVLGPEHPDTLMTMNNLALVLLDRRKPAEAEPILRQLLQVRPDPALGPNRPRQHPIRGWAGLSPTPARPGRPNHSCARRWKSAARSCPRVTGRRPTPRACWADA